MDEGFGKLKQPTQKVVEYLDGLTIDGKNIEFVSDVQAKSISENYVEVKVTFIASDYKLLKNSKIPDKRRYTKIKQGYRDFKIYGLPYFIEHHMAFTRTISSILAALVTSLACLLLGKLL